jgi:hypothetical protein
MSVWGGGGKPYSYLLHYSHGGASYNGVTGCLL